MDKTMSEGQSALPLFTTLDLTLITTSFVILTGRHSTDAVNDKDSLLPLKFNIKKLLLMFHLSNYLSWQPSYVSSVINNVPVPRHLTYCFEYKHLFYCALMLFSFVSLSFFSTPHRVTLGFNYSLLTHPLVTSQRFIRESLTFC